MNTTITDRIIDIFNSNLPIIGSWGSKNYESIEGGIEFQVNGLLFSGTIQIVESGSQENFIVRQLVDASRTVKEHLDVPQDKLVQAIDEIVEKNCTEEEYSSRIFSLYNW
ncbi:MAG: hypothetical protein PUF62_06125 [Bacteroidales bacterium]|nr:hypothetical protein [Bacteroidales bacterium]